MDMSARNGDNEENVGEIMPFNYTAAVEMTNNCASAYYIVY